MPVTVQIDKRKNLSEIQNQRCEGLRSQMSVGKGLVLLTWGSEFNPQIPVQSEVWWHVLAPWGGERNRGNLWGKPSLMGKLQDSVRHPVSENKMEVSWERKPEIDPWPLPEHTDICAPTTNKPTKLSQRFDICSSLKKKSNHKNVFLFCIYDSPPSPPFHPSTFLNKPRN